MEQPPALPPLAPEKKGLPALAWVGIGCGTLVVIAVVTVSILILAGIKKFKEPPHKAIAAMIVRAHPDLTTISEDEEAGKMTLRTPDGGVQTLSYAEIAQGKLTVTTADGQRQVLAGADLADVPSWVPVIPGLDKEVTVFHADQGKRISGYYRGQTTETAETVEETFRREAELGGLTQSSRVHTDVAGRLRRTVKLSGGNRSLELHLSGTTGQPLDVTLGYWETR